MGNPINDKLYAGRQDFCVAALTGVLGSGFEELNQLISSKERLMAAVRPPQVIAETIPAINAKGQDSEQVRKEAIQRNLFYRKYSICHTYADKYYAPFKVLKYNTALWLYTFRFFINEIRNDNSIPFELRGKVLEEKVQGLIANNYSAHISKDGVVCGEYKPIQEQLHPYLFDIFHQRIEWEHLYDEIYSTPDFLNEKQELTIEDKKHLASIFFHSDSYFYNCVDIIKTEMLQSDYYLYCMFNWHLDIFLRAYGMPIHVINGEVGQNDELYIEHNNLFDVVQLIANIIKGYHKSKDLQGEKEGCRICIDSLRNSFEAKYLQERFSAFYLVNVSNKDIYATIEQNISNNNKQLDAERLKLIYKATCQLYKQEASSEANKGGLAMHDVDTCIANAEIHITYRQYNEQSIQTAPARFYYLAEQWMKYATLIQRPGLFTPDTDERCMQIAYTAKYNSGCISRQVGAVITNQDGSIRTIGWNDPPYGQIPCALRDIRNLLQDPEWHLPPQSLRASYSDFELGGEIKNDGKVIEDPTMLVYRDSQKNFSQQVNDEYRKIVIEKQSNIDALPCSFCFKDFHTKWITKEAGNPFHQRAIHAEENAMMQMVKYGGESLKGGVIYVTASPCEICSKKLYQIGVRKIIFIDPYPGIARNQVIANGLLRPELINYEGVYGATYFKLYSHFIDYKDELKICGLEVPALKGKKE